MGILLLFFIYKIALVDLIFYLTKIFPLRIELPLILFYSGLSLFQLLFVFFSLFEVKKEKGEDSLNFITNYGNILFFMELVVLVLCSYFLFKSGAALSRIMVVFISTFSIHPLYYILNWFFINHYLKPDIKTLKLRFLSPVFFYAVSFLFSFIFITYKIFIEKKFLFFDIVVFSSVILINMFTIFIFYFKICYNIKLFSTKNKVSDLITLYLKNIFDRKGLNKNELSFFDSEYLSLRIKKFFIDNGFSFSKEEYDVTIVSIRFFSSSDSKIENLDLEKFFKTIGLYAREYDAFPYFCLDQVFLIFGFPFDYEHRNYNAVELIERILKDRVQQNEEVKLFLHASVCEGKILPYLVNIRGMGMKEIYIRGEGLQLAEKLSLVAEANGIHLLISSDLYQKMRERVYIEKGLKIKEKDKEIVVYKVRL